MAKNKDQADLQTTPVASELEARVHDMMDVDAKPASVVMPEQAEAVDLPPLDIFTETVPGAPAVSSDLSLPEEDQITEPSPEELVADTIEPLQPEASATEITIPPLELDTPDSDAAIADIVAQEADAVLAAEDAGITQANDEAEPIEDEPQKRGHPIFWFFIVLLVIIAVTASVMLVRPDLVPFSA